MEVNKTWFWSIFGFCFAEAIPAPSQFMAGAGSPLVLTGAPVDMEVFPQPLHLYSCGCLFTTRMKSILCLHMCVTPLAAWDHGIHQHLPAAASWHESLEDGEAMLLRMVHRHHPQHSLPLLGFYLLISLVLFSASSIPSLQVGYGASSCGTKWMIPFSVLRNKKEVVSSTEPHLKKMKPITEVKIV